MTLQRSPVAFDRCRSPWVLKYPYCHQMITQTHPTRFRTLTTLRKGEHA